MPTEQKGEKISCLTFPISGWQNEKVQGEIKINERKEHP